MRFRDTYSQAVRDSRRIRAQRAGFWAKWVSLALVLTVGATLRSEPQLRLTLMSKGMDAVASLSGQTPPPASPVPQDASLQSLLSQVGTDSPAPQRPRDAVKVNRPGLDPLAGPGIQRIRVAPAPEAPTQPQLSAPTATEIGKLLQQLQSDR